MTDTATVPATAGARPLGLFARIIGVLFSPRATYANIAAWPKILGVLAFVILVTGGLQTWFLSSEPGKRALLNTIEQGIRQSEAQGREVTPEQRQGIVRLAGIMGYVSAGAQVVLAPAFLAVISLIILWLFNALLGGDVTFRQVFAVVTHSAVVTTVGAMFTTPLMYVRGEMVSPTQLAVFLPSLEDGFVSYLLRAVDLMFIWWIVSLAIGLAVLYKRRTGPVATTLLVTYAAIALLIATVRSL